MGRSRHCVDDSGMADDGNRAVGGIVPAKDGSDTGPDGRMGLPPSFLASGPLSSVAQKVLVRLRRYLAALPRLRPVRHPFMEVKFHIHANVQVPRQDHRRLQRPGHRRSKNEAYVNSLKLRRQFLGFSHSLLSERQKIDAVPSEPTGVGVVVDASVTNQEEPHVRRR